MSDLVNRFIHKYSRLPTERDPDYLEMLRMSKYRILAVPDVQPGKCANCGASKNDGRKYIDVGLQIEWYGAIYFCGLCLDELARSMGLYLELESRLKTAEAKLQTVESLRELGKEQHKELVQAFRELETYYADLHSASVSSSPNGSSSVGTDEKESNKSRITSTKSRTSKSTSSSGSQDLPSLAELLSTDPE